MLLANKDLIVPQMMLYPSFKSKNAIVLTLTEWFLCVSEQDKPKLLVALLGIQERAVNNFRDK